MEPAGNFSVAALGTAGAFTVEVLSRPNGGWLLSVESPGWCFTFDLAGASVVGELATFLRSHACQAKLAELVVGSFGETIVRIVKDDEFVDRLFLQAAGGGLLIEFALVGGAALEFATAAADAAANFEAPALPIDGLTCSQVDEGAPDL